MADELYWCRQCHEVIKVPVSNCRPNPEPAKCTACGSQDLDELKQIDTGPPPADPDRFRWEFVCRHCFVYFEVPAPKGPKAALDITCPLCGGSAAERIHVVSLETMARTCFG